MNWRKLVTMIVVLSGVALTAWIWETLPEPNAIVFDLTAMEVKTEAGLLRHPDARALTCTVLDSEGAVVANISHNRIDAVSLPTIVELPPGDYAFQVEITFQREKEAPRVHTQVITQTLSGGTTRVRL